MPQLNILKALLFVCILFSSHSLIAQSTRWKHRLDSANIFSSPRFADLNNDGIKDVVVGAGVENVPVSNGILAVNGKDGSILWKVSAPTQIYTSALFQDITEDGTPDVFIGGRAGCLYAINGASGEVIWQFWKGTQSKSLEQGILNFFLTQWLDDQNKDGYQDLLVTNGGDYMVPPNDSNRAVANLMIVSGKDGTILAKAKMPEKRESYYAPHTYTNGETTTIVFGTGGETINGGLWKTTLQELLENDIQKSDVIIRDEKKGFILNSLMTDLNGDGVSDIINARMNATLAAIDGNNNKVLWEHSFNGFECYVTPTLGKFVGNETPDLFTIIAEGTFPAYKSFKLIVIDGNTGEIAWEKESGFNQFSPAISADLNSDGIDEILYVENKIVDMKTFESTNQLKVIDLLSKDSHYLGTVREGLSMASSPGIIDLESDGNHEIIVATSSIENENTVQFSIIECIELETPCGRITWPGYLGPNENGMYK